LIFATGGKAKSHTVFVASSDSGRTARIRVPALFVQVLAFFAFIGGASIMVAAASYMRILWKAADYNALRGRETVLRRQYGQMQMRMGNTTENLNALQSLAGELTMAYGVTSYRRLRLGSSTAASAPESSSEFRRSVEEFEYLESASLAGGDTGRIPPLLSAPGLGDWEFIPSLWPVKGRITAFFGERLDPFSGEGAFHTGIDIASHFGDAIHSTADGIVTFVGERPGYGKVIIIGHGFGYTTLYAHLSKFATVSGADVKRGDVIGYEGQSGRATGPHLHYEVRINNEPVNPWRFLHKFSSPREGVTKAGD
jgi:murein DD-endopeptidase MepM/ murein hydrolase activator NlpD